MAGDPGTGATGISEILTRLRIQIIGLVNMLPIVGNARPIHRRRAMALCTGITGMTDVAVRLRRTAGVGGRETMTGIAGKRSHGAPYRARICRDDPCRAGSAIAVTVDLGAGAKGCARGPVAGIGGRAAGYRRHKIDIDQIIDMVCCIAFICVSIVICRSVRMAETARTARYIMTYLAV